jgi:ABC-2 type transport system ATP-binding protein
LTWSQDRDEAVRTDAEPELVGKIALDAGIALVELRAAGGDGLEAMFFDLTSTTQREGIPA